LTLDCKGRLISFRDDDDDDDDADHVIDYLLGPILSNYVDQANLLAK